MNTYKPKIKLAMAILSLLAIQQLAITSASAANIGFNGGGADRNWQTSANWAGGTIPIATDNAYMQTSGSNSALINSTGAVATNLYVGAAMTGGLEMTAGSLAVQTFIVGNLANGNGTFSMSGGNVTVGGDTRLNWVNPGGSATMNITGGTFTTPTLYLPITGGNAGLINLWGGTLNVTGSFIFNNPSGTAVLNMEGPGKLTWGGNHVTDVNTFITRACHELSGTKDCTLYVR